MKCILTGPDRLTLTLDSLQIFPLAPAEGTPAVVSVSIGDLKYAATFEQAIELGMLAYDGCYYHLTPEQMTWLSDREEEVGLWLKMHANKIRSAP